MVRNTVVTYNLSIWWGLFIYHWETTYANTKNVNPFSQLSKGADKLPPSIDLFCFTCLLFATTLLLLFCVFDFVGYDVWKKDVAGSIRRGQAVWKVDGILRIVKTMWKLFPFRMHWQPTDRINCQVYHEKCSSQVLIGTRRSRIRK